jgi:hypothetical protein
METKFKISWIENDGENYQWADTKEWGDIIYNDYVADENKSNVILEERNDFLPIIPNE